MKRLLPLLLALWFSLQISWAQEYQILLRHDTTILYANELQIGYKFLKVRPFGYRGKSRQKFYLLAIEEVRRFNRNTREFDPYFGNGVDKRPTLKNTITFNVGGQASLYNLQYERRIPLSRSINGIFNFGVGVIPPIRYLFLFQRNEPIYLLNTSIGILLRLQGGLHLESGGYLSPVNIGGTLRGIQFGLRFQRDFEGPIGRIGIQPELLSNGSIMPFYLGIGGIF